MGTREIRYCDISGSEQDVEPHELNIDQMRLEIDLSATEYRKLLDLLRPYIDAGRIEASAPNLPPRAAKPRSLTQSARTPLTGQQRAQLRRWAQEKGIPVPVNNRFKGTLIDQWRNETGR